MASEAVDEADGELHALLGHVLEKGMLLCNDKRGPVLAENVRTLKLLLGRWAPRLGAKLPLRRRLILKQLKARSKGDEAREVQWRKAALHLLNALLANHLPLADDEAATTEAQWVRQTITLANTSPSPHPYPFGRRGCHERGRMGVPGPPTSS